jgi:hypothetical protein
MVWTVYKSCFDPKQGQMTFMFTTSRLALGSNQPSTPFVWGGGLLPRGKSDRGREIVKKF